MAFIAMQEGNQKLYSTCIYVMFPNTMVLVKLFVIMNNWIKVNLLMDWIKGCFETKYGIEVVDDIWKTISKVCMLKTIRVTR